MANASDRRPLEVLAEMFSEFVPDPETPPATDIHFYMAANYPRLTEIHMRALELEAITGWKPVSSWHSGAQEGVVGGTEPEVITDELRLKWAEGDVLEINSTHVLVVHDDVPGMNRGGFMWEWGYAWAGAKTIIVIGQRRNVFALLKGNYYFPDWDGFLSALRAERDRKGV
jgi:hypothetical protein